jgi:hypothetical protein
MEPRPIGIPFHHQEEVFSATFSTDGKFLVTWSNDHIYTWKVPCHLEQRPHLHMGCFRYRQRSWPSVRYCKHICFSCSMILTTHPG